MFARDFVQSCALMVLLTVMFVFAGCGADQSGADSDSGTATTNDSATDRGVTRRAMTTQSGAERPVDSETLPYAEVNEELVYGYFAFPSDMIEPLPAIILIHDWWGLNDDTREAASRLAGEGYMVLAIDLYDGEIAGNIADARSMMISIVENPDDVSANLRQALAFVDVAGAPKKATMGWGFGGSWSLSSAMLFPDQLDAAVIYYGQVNEDEDNLRAIRAPILGIFGAKDRGIKLETVKRFEAAMRRLRQDLTLQVYPDAGHAFADPARQAYDADLSEDAWRRTTEFLAARLAPDDEP